MYLGEQYVNNPTLSDVTFLVEVTPCAALPSMPTFLHAARPKLLCHSQALEQCGARQGRKFFAHRIALLASSDTFRAMFDGHYKEKEASQIPIPNIRFCVFESMMRCIYTGGPPMYGRGMLVSHF